MIELREFDRSDLPAVMAIQQAITKKKVSRIWTRMLERHLESTQGLGFVATQGGKVVGFALGEVKGEGFGLSQSGWIEVVGVDPQAMGEGIGTALLEELFRAFRRKRIKSVYTAVRWDAVDMLSFFKALGFGRSDFINLVHKL